MYSLALATFQLSLADDKLLETADKLLQDALISFPDVLLPLLGMYYGKDTILVRMAKYIFMFFLIHFG